MRNSTQGRMDLPAIAERLMGTVVSNTTAAVGQHASVVLVTHSLGNLVAKELCHRAAAESNAGR